MDAVIQIFVFSKMHVLKPGPQCGGVMRWSLGRWLAHEGGAPMDGISALIKNSGGVSLNFSHGGM